MGRFDSVDDTVIKSLDDKGAVKLLHKLIMSEIRRLTIPFSLVSVPYEVDVKDGGVDAVVNTDAEITDSLLLFKGKTYYQSKSGENVTFTKAGLKKVLCEDTKEKALKPKIREIARENGHLVLYFTGKSAPKIEEAITVAKEIITDELPDSLVEVHIVQTEAIIDMLDSYISLRHQLLNFQGYPGWDFGEWEKQSIMSNHFEVDENRQNLIDNLKANIRNTDDESKLIRVTGYPGIGKTRSVLEALREPDLAPLVIYFDKPSQVLDTNLITEIGARRSNTAIIVVDECTSLSHSQLTNAMASIKSQIKVITIYNEPLGSTPGVRTIDFNDEDARLSSETVIAIIESYKLPNDVAQRWEVFCDGSPRVAHMIAENLSRDTGDLLDNPSYDKAMERILANTDQLESDTFSRRKDILSWLSLFSKFGWSREHSEERKFILYKIQEKTNFSENEIETVIEELKKRKVLQGDKTLYISPRLLHIRAWVWWWERYGKSFDLAEIQSANFAGQETAMSPDLYLWFTEMFQYAREVEGASEVVKHILSSDGPLQNEPKILEAIKGNFFLSLTKADPEGALLVLERWLKNKSDEEIGALPVDRMNLVRSLETIAVWKELFVRAAELLLRIAATEHDHTYSNNSEGTFADLFSNGPGKVAPTEASPAERLPVLERALASGDERRQLMAINGLNHALEATHFSRMMGPEIQGLREEPKLWTPATYAELYDAFKAAWELLVKSLPNLPEKVREKAVETIDHKIRGLLLRSGYPDHYLEDYAELVKDNIIPTGDAVNTVNIIRRFDLKDMSPELQSQIEALVEYLDGDTITSRLKRYIAYNSTEDWWGEDEDIKKSESKVAELVKEVVANPAILDENDWLFSTEAQNGHRLGRGLCQIDRDQTILPKLLELQKKNDQKFKKDSSFVLTSGYLAELYTRNPALWQETMDLLAKDTELVHWFAEACWRSHLDNRNANTLLMLIKQDMLGYKDLHMFRYGGVVKELSDNVLNQWIEYLLSLGKLEATAIAIDLFSSYYVFQEKRKLPADLTLRLITSPTLAENNRQLARDIDYDWSQVAERYIQQYPDDSDVILDTLLENFGEDDTIYGSYGGYIKNVMNRLVKFNPQKAWEKVSKYLVDNKHSYRLELSWLGGSMSFGDRRPEGAITLFPMKLIFDWIEQNPKKHAPCIAQLVPHDFDHDEGEISWFAEILDKYGEDKAVINSISANFGSEGFSGPASLHYAKKVEIVKRFASLHKESINIQSWANDNIGYLNNRIKDARLQEERRDY